MIAIIKYNAGNVKSVENAIRRLGFDCRVTDDKEKIVTAEKVILPGVGEASSAMNYLKRHQLVDLIKSLKQPVLGICLGQQLMCSHSEEGDIPCMGIFNTAVKKFPSNAIVPHMGWNSISDLRGPIWKGINADDTLYFVHSYYAEISRETTAICDYILPFSAAMQKENFYGTQFHPEKSAGVGERILFNFLSL